MAKKMKTDISGIAKPESLSGIAEPEPSGPAGINPPDPLSGTREPARHWGVDLGKDKGKGCEAYDGLRFTNFSTITDVAIAAAAAGIGEVRIERTDIPFGMKKSAMKAEFNSRGVKLVQVHPLRTANYRKAKSLGKTDANDAFVLYHLKCDFSEPREVSDDWKDFSAKVNSGANKVRYGVGGGNTLAAREILTIVGKKNVPKEVLTKSGGLSVGALSYAIAVLNTRGRHSAERLAGVYGNGHSSYLRSNVFKYGFALAKNNQGIPYTTYRRGLRRFGAVVRAHREEIIRALPHLAA